MNGCTIRFRDNPPVIFGPTTLFGPPGNVATGNPVIPAPGAGTNLVVNTDKVNSENVNQLPDGAIGGRDLLVTAKTESQQQSKFQQFKNLVTIPTVKPCQPYNDTTLSFFISLDRQLINVEQDIKIMVKLIEITSTTGC